MYTGVPITTPVPVRCSVPAVRAGRAMPKSATMVLPSRVSRMFSGLTSRWITPLLVGVLETTRDFASDPHRFGG